MTKIKYIALIALFLLLSLIFFRKSLVYRPTLNHLEKRFEKKWNCEIDKKSADLNLLKGSLTFKDTHLTTPQNADSRWTLDVDEIFIQIDYSSVFSANLIINELILDRLIFRHDEVDSDALKREHMPPPMTPKQIDKEDLGKEKVKGKGALVRNLLIRNGYFKFHRLTASGKVSEITVEHLTINRRNIFLGRELYVFFKSLLEPLGYFADIRP
jgi:hypothetical protein